MAKAQDRTPSWSPRSRTCQWWWPFFQSDNARAYTLFGHPPPEFINGEGPFFQSHNARPIIVWSRTRSCWGLVGIFYNVYQTWLTLSLQNTTCFANRKKKLIVKQPIPMRPTCTSFSKGNTDPGSTPEKLWGLLKDSEKSWKTKPDKFVDYPIYHIVGISFLKELNFQSEIYLSMNRESNVSIVKDRGCWNCDEARSRWEDRLREHCFPFVVNVEEPLEPHCTRSNIQKR